MAANINENSSSSKYQLSSTIQRTSGGTESRRSKTSGSRRSRRMGSGKNFK